MYTLTGLAYYIVSVSFPQGIFDMTASLNKRYQIESMYSSRHRPYTSRLEATYPKINVEYNPMKRAHKN